MNRIILYLALIGFVSCASLDHLQYLPPQARGNQASDVQQPFAAPAAPSGNFQTGESVGPSDASHGPSGSFGAAPGPQGPSGSFGATSGPQGPAGPGPVASHQGQFGQNGGAPGGGAQSYSGQQYPEQRSPLADVPILRLDTENPGDGTYRYAYETGNGIAAQEEGSAQSGWNKARGSYQFTSPEGQNFEISYTADENGYVPQGAHLPTSPPIPDAILRSLEVIRQAEAEGRLEGQYQPEGDDGQYRESHDEGQYNQGQTYQKTGAGNSNGFTTQNGAQQQFGGNQGGPHHFGGNQDSQQHFGGNQGEQQQFGSNQGGQQHFGGEQGGQQAGQPSVANNGGYQY